MKILMTEKYMRNLIKISQNTIPFMYHVTSEQNVSLILKEGLKANRQQNGFTERWIGEYYRGRIPIFLSIEPWTVGNNFKAIKINTSGLRLVADIPSVVDNFAHYDEDNGVLWWEEENEHFAGSLVEYMEDGEISIDELLTSGEIIEAAIDITDTAAVLEDIPPERIIGVLDTYNKEKEENYNKEISEQFPDTSKGLEDDNPVSGIDY